MANEVEVRIKDIIQRTYNVKSFRLDVPDADFKAGQFLFLTIKAEKEIGRPLSISNSPTEKGFLEFTKKLTGKEFSNALGSLKVGDMVRVKYPYGNFTFNGEYPEIAFLSGGIGITPIRSICKYIVDKKLGIDIVLLYGNKTINDISFKDDFDIMQKNYNGLKVINIISEPDPKWKGRGGYINSQIVKEEIPDYNGRKYFICGPPAMVESMKKILLNELLLPNNRIITESFIGY